MRVIAHAARVRATLAAIAYPKKRPHLMRPKIPVRKRRAKIQAAKAAMLVTNAMAAAQIQVINSQPIPKYKLGGVTNENKPELYGEIWQIPALGNQQAN